MFCLLPGSRHTDAKSRITSAEMRGLPRNDLGGEKITCDTTQDLHSVHAKWWGDRSDLNLIAARQSDAVPPFIHFQNCFLCSAIAAFVLKFKQSVTGRDNSFRSHRKIAGGAKRTFNVTTQFFYGIWKPRLIVDGYGQREPSRLIIQPKSLALRVILFIGGMLLSVERLLITIFYSLVGSL
jgi:hypothetical protein